MIVDEIHTSAVKMLIRRFEIAKQEANINLAEEEAVAAAVKAAELAAVYEPNILNLLRSLLLSNPNQLCGCIHLPGSFKTC